MGSKGKNKIGQPKINSSSAIFPHFKPTFNSEFSKPYFSFKYLSKKYCITKCENDEKIGFVDKMYSLSQLTWNEIKNSHRHGLGTEKIERTAFKTAIPHDITPDVTFLAIRFHGTKPMVGYRENATFYIIWFDRDYTVYDHGS